MKLSLFDSLGKSGLDPERAASFVNEIVVPQSMISGGKIVLDFQGVQNVNSSFVNALFLNLLIKFGPEIIRSRLQVVNCRRNISEIVEAGLEYSLDRSMEFFTVK